MLSTNTPNQTRNIQITLIKLKKIKKVVNSKIISIFERKPHITPNEAVFNIQFLFYYSTE